MPGTIQDNSFQSTLIDPRRFAQSLQLLCAWIVALYRNLSTADILDR